MAKNPEWFILGEELLSPTIGIGLATIKNHRSDNANLDILPYLALLHLAGCLESSSIANRNGKHSAAICLVRQCVEALTIVDLGLQDASYANPLLEAWNAGKKTHGQLRARLEADIWPRYGHGLWDESWSEFFSNLARAVQPYAHYTHELAGWQMQTIHSDGTGEFMTLIGLQTYDALLATRITLLHMLTGWALGRMLVIHGTNPDILSRVDALDRLGKAIARSKLLFAKHDWGVQLAPHMFFTPGYDWRDT